MKKKWIIKDPDPQQQVSLSDALGVHPFVAQLLINRDVIDHEEASQFLNPLPAHLHDPMLMKDMDRAIERLNQARDRGERVMIFGDYDVDGVTSSAVLRRGFKEFGLDAINYIPHRVDEGYGLNVEIALIAKEKGVGLIVTVDCGISAFDEVDAINEQGIDVIILDHHTPDGDRVPNAVAVVDPKRPDCPYPFKHMAAVGLAAKCVHALLGQFPTDDLDLIAIGTVADVVPLRGENRIFVRYGLPKIPKTRKPGLQALLDVTKIKGKELKPHYIGFVIGPRINAAGRMESATTALELLISEDHQEAQKLARTLEGYNQDRQKMQRDVVQDAMSLVEANELEQSDQIIVVHKEGWHKGVVGIVASRIMEKYQRPSIVISSHDGIGVGSARSFAGFHLYDALAHCSDHLEAFGGHKMAAGLTVRDEKIKEFKEAINQFAKQTVMVDEGCLILDVDVDISLAQLNLDVVKLIQSLAPYGEGNREPILCTRNLKIKSRPQILGKNTLKFWVTDGQISVSAVGFGMGELAETLSVGQHVDLAYNLAIDDWNKAPTVQLTLKDVIVKDIRQQNKDIRKKQKIKNG